MVKGFDGDNLPDEAGKVERPRAGGSGAGRSHAHLRARTPGRAESGAGFRLGRKIPCVASFG